MKNVWMGLALVAGLGVMDLGCKDACTSATDRLVARYQECGITVRTSGATPANLVCSRADAESLECNADCAESASCGALDGSDTQGGADYNTCNADCK